MKLKKIISGILVVALAFSITGDVCAATIDNVKVEKEVKNVILLIPDGMSTGGLTLARWYNGGEELNLDSMASGLVRTYSADAPIADSAPAGTAMATGFKSHTGFVGVLPDENTMPGLNPIRSSDKRKPVASILEAAKLNGKATGIIATSEIMHATPADFTAHDPSRKNYDSISEQQVYQNLDVVIGGGEKFFTSELRGDKEDLLSVIKKEYRYASTPVEFHDVTSGKLWAMFAPSALSYDFDRNPSKEPSLGEMTKKAIDLLSKDQDGFFLMVEGSKIDWAAHANDPIGMISDILAFDKAVGVALDFAKNDGNTLVISATDHGNSGITIGASSTDNTYDTTPLSSFIDPLKKATLTGEGIGSKLNKERSNVEAVMKNYFGITDLSKAEIKAIKNTADASMNYTVGPIIAKRANIGFTTKGHTGEDVTLYVYAPESIDQLTGTVENADIALYMAKAMGLNLNETTKKLFVKAEDAYVAKGAAVKLDTADETNPVLIVNKGAVEVKMPVNKNIAYVNGEKTLLDGVVVYNGINTYVPQSAVDLVK
ncbi:alkaline phosphatase [Mobilisporobacter senegalensis]|uniref:Alkaline phosphatase n=1 Tax=Mobilisporobacter senegalensis TaxID=1329262 RepID=A0A3N1XSQ3_9FIRM|nr:alkaline phosphatase [Mobilisporobacter senegalensis]ROR29278.1 alkaline phosphatase [Mobilisporobacter senegalensis]